MPEVVLEWWQWLIAALAAVGFSAAPWIVALLAGRLVTKGVYDREAKRADREQERADAAIGKLSELTTEFGETAVKLLDSLPKAKETK